MKKPLKWYRFIVDFSTPKRRTEYAFQLACELREAYAALYFKHSRVHNRQAVYTVQGHDLGQLVAIVQRLLEKCLKIKRYKLTTPYAVDGSRLRADTFQLAVSITDAAKEMAIVNLSMADHNTSVFDDLCNMLGLGAQDTADIGFALAAKASAQLKDEALDRLHTESVKSKKVKRKP